MSRVARVASMVLVVLISGLTSGCGGGDAGQAPGPAASDVPLITAGPAAANDGDRAFATGILAQRPQVTQLAALARSNAANPDLVALSESIAAAQTDEGQTVKVLLVQWTGGADQTPNTAPTLIDAATVERLGSLQGREFDTLWLQAMIGHHEGVVRMADTELTDGENIDAKALAKTVRGKRQAELEQLRQMLGGQ